MKGQQLNSVGACLATGDRIFATGSDGVSKAVLRSCGCFCLISGHKIMVWKGPRSPKHSSGEKKQHKHKLFGPDFPRTFLTLTPGRPWVKKFLPITGAAEKRAFWCGRPRFLARTSMTRRGFEKLCTKKFALIFWPLIVRQWQFAILSFTSCLYC